MHHTGLAYPTHPPKPPAETPLFSGSPQDLLKLRDEVERVQAAVDLIELPGFRYSVEVVGGKACLCTGMEVSNEAGDLSVLWDAPYFFTYHASAIEVARRAMDHSFALWRSFTKRNFRFDGRTVFARDC